MDNVTTHRKPLVPQLRFKEFDGEWEEKKLGEVSSFAKGKNISKADIVENGKFECIRYGELYTVYGEVIENIISRTNLDEENLIFSEYNDVIIPASGETQIDIATASCVLKDGIALGGDLNIIKSKANGTFLSYYLNSVRKIDIARLSQGNSVVHLYSKQLKTLNLNVPKDEEQQKIAKFLTAVDQKIQQLRSKKEQLEQYKKGAMQQLFSQELRFKDDDGNDFADWEEKTLGEVCTFFSGGTPTSTNKQFYLGEIPFIGSGNIYDSKVSNFISEKALNSSSAKIVKKGDLLYALYGANSGEVAISKLSGAINQAILCIRTEETIEYLYYILLSNKNRITAKYLQGGQGNLSSKIIKNLKYKLPSLKEQQKIAAYLSSLDAKIEAVGTQIKNTQEFKKGLLQQLFV
jgi:type I restriction enzyme S subunit